MANIIFNQSPLREPSSFSTKDNLKQTTLRARVLKSHEQRIRELLNTPLAKRPLPYLMFLPFWVFASAVVAIVAWVRRHASRPQAIPKTLDRVLCVGNVIMGGTGKSPAIHALIQEGLGRGFAIAILTRGAGTSSPQEEDKGDESIEHLEKWDSAHVRVFQDQNRRLSLDKATFWLEGLPKSGLVFLDDGLQHTVCPRDWDLVVWDPHLLSKSPASSFPLGPYREGFLGGFKSIVDRVGHVRLWSRCFLEDFEAFRKLCEKSLKRFHLKPDPKKDVIVIKKLALKRFSPSLASFVASDAHESFTSGAHVAALCGIGSPESFFDDARHILAEKRLFAEIAASDHGHLPSGSLELIKGADALLMTAKDEARWRFEEWLQPWKKAGSLFILELNVEFLNWEGQRVSLLDWVEEHCPRPPRK